MDVGPMEESLAEVIPLFAESTPLLVTVGAPAAIVLGGAQLETALLRNQKWDNFWIGVGGHLTDVWSGAGHFLFGHPSSAPSLDTVSQLIQLSMHIGMRANRQLITKVASKTAAAEAMLGRAIFSVAHTVSGLTAWTAAQIAGLRAELHADVASLRAAIAGTAANVSHYVDAAIASRLGALRAELIRDVTNPIHSEVVNLGRSLQHLHDVVVIDHAKLWTEVAPIAGAALVIAHQAQAAAAAAKAWEDDCGEPMCQTVGPKTDWGKLLKRFGPSAIFALLAAIAAEHPEEVEKVAETLGDALGPVLASWATDYLGLTHGDTGKLANQVGDRVGQFKF